MVGPWHTTVTAALRAGDLMTGDLMTGDRDPTAIVPPTVPRTDPIGADRRTNPAHVRHVPPRTKGA
jgi:hypothetical protein